MREKGYTIYDKYLIRQPYFGYNKSFWNFIEESEECFLQEICNNKILREAILVSSPELYYAIIRFQNGKITSKKKLKGLKLAVIDYYNRMSARCTPYGLYASIGCGSTEIENSCLKRKFKKIISLDWEWLLKYVKYIEKNYCFLFEFKKNNIIETEGPYISIPYIPLISDSPVKVLLDDEILGILRKCENKSICYEDIASDFSKNKINKLIENDFLISNIRPSTSERNVLYFLKNKLNCNECLKDEYNFVCELIELFQLYESKEDGENIILEIIKKMEEKICNKDYINVDLLNESPGCVLNSFDADKILDFIKFITCLLSNVQSNSLYKEYKDVFYERYGEYAEVPLLDMLNPLSGIGVPLEYKEHKSKIRGDKTYEKKPSDFYIKRINEKCIEAIVSQKKVCLEKLFAEEHLNNAVTSSSIPESMDFVFRVYEDTNGKVIACNQNLGCIDAGRYIGKYLSKTNMFDEYYYECTGVPFKEDENILNVDLSYLPSRVRLANVATSVGNENYELAFFTNSSYEKKEISINDIYVGIENDKFYLKCKSLNKRIKIKTNNLLYFYGDCPIIRFLKEVQYDGMISFNNIFDGTNLDNQLYIPEIRYKDIVLSFEKWCFDLSSKKDMSCFEFESWFDDQIKLLKISKHCFSYYGDNYLLLDIEKKICREILYKQFKKTGIIKLESADEYFKNCNDVLSFFEVVVSVGAEKTNNEIKRSQYIRNIYDSSVNVLPGENWLYLKLYGFKNEEELLITINNEIKKCFTNNSSEFFFTRYKQNFRELRLRIKVNNKDDNLEIINILNSLIKKELFVYFDICTYQRELQRYGGINCIEAVEDVFIKESAFCLTFFEENKGMILEECLLKYCMFIFDLYLKIFISEPQKKLVWLEKYKSSQSNFADIKMFINEENFSSELNKKLNDLSKSVEFYRDKLIENDFDECEIYNILRSLTHMFFNRFIGMDRKNELNVIDCLYLLNKSESKLKKHTILSKQSSIND